MFLSELVDCIDNRTVNVLLNEIVAATSTEEPLVHSKVVNPHNFNYLIEPGQLVCGADQGESLFLIVYVHSEPSNLKRRICIRETWSKQSMFRRVRLVFMLGLSMDTRQNELVRLESSMYGDIVQENFMDSYKNLTYKGIMAMKWLSERCSRVPYVLKADDDMVVNTFTLVRHLYNMNRRQIATQRTIMCLVWVGMGVIRDKSSKWYISPAEFAKNTYDTYCSGSAFILTGDLTAPMFNVSFYIKFFWVDDFHISGQMAKAVNASHYAFNSLYMINTYLVESTFLNSKQHLYTVFGHLPSHLNAIYSIWDYIVRFQLTRFPSLFKANATLVQPNDFKYLSSFKWSTDIWQPLIEAQYEPSFDDYDTKLDKSITVDI